MKGIGEAGTIGSTPAVINAIVDALAPLGVTDVPMPASPMRVWEAIAGPRRRRRPARGKAGRDPKATPTTGGAA